MADFSSSELDSMSDSDWLDISSRASEISDLVGSDAEDAFSRPHSPHPSDSSSDRHDEPDRWEGIIEPEDAEDTHSEDADVDDRDDLPPNAQGTVRARDVPHHRLVEEIREREALEQSMVSTLSASRNSSLSASASGTPSPARSRDLRLSFPDPLTSSRDELNRSYDNVEIDVPLASSPTSPILSLAPGNVIPELTSPVASEEPIRPVPSESSQPPSAPEPDIQVVLYGSQPCDKFHLVETLLGKLAVGSDLVLSQRQPLTTRVHNYMLDGKSKPFASAVTVQIVDNIVENAEILSTSAELPSLAVIFFPHYLPTLPHHTLYLPVVETRREGAEVNEGFSADLLRGCVNGQWDALRTPASQTLLWHVETPAAVMSEDEVAALDPAEVVLGFEPLIPRRRRFINALRAQVAAAPALTIIAILSLVLGYIVSLSSPVAISADREAVSAVVEAFTNVSNLTSFPIPSPTRSAAQQPASIMSALSVSLSTVPPSIREAPSAVLTPVAVPEKPKAPEPLNPTTHCPAAQSLSLVSTKSVVVAALPVKSVVVPRKVAFELSTRLASSIQDLFNPHILIAAVRADMKELLDALDALLQVISVNAQDSIILSLSAADNLRDNLRRRHRRAQDRARRLRDKGASAWADASRRVSERMDVARRRAKAIHDSVGEEAQAMMKRARKRAQEVTVF